MIKQRNKKIVVIIVVMMILLSIQTILYAQTIGIERQTIIESVVEKCSKSIVSVTSYHVSKRNNYNNGDPFFKRIYKSQKRAFGMGSGFFVSPDGYILTNNHVIEGADEIRVSMVGGEKYKAKLIGRDKLMDIALLKIDITNAPFLEFEDYDKIKIGDWAIAFGHPFGFLYSNSKPTVTAGIISNKDINFGEQRSLIQTDAAINPGNSGGALINSRGKLIGMNTLRLEKYGERNGQGLGFAINPKILQEYYQIFKSGKKLDRDFILGVGYKDIDEELQKKYNLSKDQGVMIFKVKKNSIADKAGLKIGDVIINIDGTRIGIADDFLVVINSLYKGKTTTITVIRRGKEKVLTLKIQ